MIINDEPQWLIGSANTVNCFWNVGRTGGKRNEGMTKGIKIQKFIKVRNTVDFTNKTSYKVSKISFKKFSKFFLQENKNLHTHKTSDNSAHLQVN